MNKMTLNLPDKTAKPKMPRMAVAISQLIAKRRFDEAETTLKRAEKQFAGHAWPTRLSARLARARGLAKDTAESADRSPISLPDDPAVCLEQVRAARKKKRWSAARELLNHAFKRFPDTPDFLVEDVRLAFAIRKYQRAIKVCEKLRLKFPMLPLGYRLGARALLLAEKHDEVDLVLRDAVAKFVDQTWLVSEYETLCEASGRWDPAIKLWSEVRDSHPGVPTGYLGLVSAFLHLQKFKEAEAVCKETMTRFAELPDGFLEYAKIALRQNRPEEAALRFAEAEARFPNDKKVGRRIFEARLASTGSETHDLEMPAVLPASVAASTPEAQEAAKLMTKFESLGGTGQGCEFGLVQRAFGAEPLGLLRWSHIEIDGLVAALETDFEGLGSAEQTKMYFGTRGNQTNPEYVVRDRRYQMAMHTFVKKMDVPWDTMFEQSCRRLAFLKQKLLEDLEDAEKILVYKMSHRDLSSEEIDKLHSLVRRHGENTLLYVRYADALHPSGTVVLDRPGLIIGYIDHFSVLPSGEARQPNLQAWEAICRQSRDLLQPSRQ